MHFSKIVKKHVFWTVTSRFANPRPRPLPVKRIIGVRCLVGLLFHSINIILQYSLIGCFPPPTHFETQQRKTMSMYTPRDDKKLPPPSEILKFLIVLAQARHWQCLHVFQWWMLDAIRLDNVATPPPHGGTSMSGHVGTCVSRHVWKQFSDPSTRGGGLRSPCVEAFVGGSDRFFQTSGDTRVPTWPDILVCNVWGRFGHVARRMASSTKHQASITHLELQTWARDSAKKLRHVPFQTLNFLWDNLLSLEGVYQNCAWRQTKRHNPKVSFFYV